MSWNKLKDDGSNYKSSFVQILGKFDNKSLNELNNTIDKWRKQQKVIIHDYDPNTEFDTESFKNILDEAVNAIYNVSNHFKFGIAQPLFPSVALVSKKRKKGKNFTVPAWYNQGSHCIIVNIEEFKKGPAIYNFKVLVHELLHAFSAHKFMQYNNDLLLTLGVSTFETDNKKDGEPNVLGVALEEALTEEYTKIIFELTQNIVIERLQRKGVQIHAPNINRQVKLYAQKHYAAPADEIFYVDNSIFKKGKYNKRKDVVNKKSGILCYSYIPQRQVLRALANKVASKNNFNAANVILALINAKFTGNTELIQKMIYDTYPDEAQKIYSQIMGMSKDPNFDPRTLIKQLM